MQVAGRNCQKCQQRILSNLEGDGCIRCDQAFHFTCIPARDTCPACGLGFRDQRLLVQAARAVERAEVAQRGGRGERIFAYAMIAVSAVAAALLYFTHRGEPSHLAFPEFLPLVGALGLYFVVCSLWFRTFILYQLKVRRAIRWYGAPVAHGSFLVMGLALLVFALLGWAHRLPF
jgi:hypothetical protein